MNDTTDTANVVIRPPIAWALAGLAALALQWLLPVPFMPAALPAPWVGGAVFAVALALAAWAIATMTRAGSNVPTNRPTTTIVGTGPYRFKRHPNYLAFVAGALRRRYPPWRRGTGGSLSQVQFRRQRSPLPFGCAAMAIAALGEPRMEAPAAMAFLALSEQEKEVKRKCASQTVSLSARRASSRFPIPDKHADLEKVWNFQMKMTDQVGVSRLLVPIGQAALKLDGHRE